MQFPDRGPGQLEAQQAGRQGLGHLPGLRRARQDAGGTRRGHLRRRCRRRPLRIHADQERVHPPGAGRGELIGLGAGRASGAAADRVAAALRRDHLQAVVLAYADLRSPARFRAPGQQPADPDPWPVRRDRARERVQRAGPRVGLGFRTGRGARRGRSRQ
ncbi:hypothetical protein KLI87_20865 [Actinomadura sp. NEAU-AAG7]|nr:hypothetical protein [Actinomadura sp. NEAU-AAG7]